MTTHRIVRWTMSVVLTACGITTWRAGGGRTDNTAVDGFTC